MNTQSISSAVSRDMRQTEIIQKTATQKNPKAFVMARDKLTIGESDLSSEYVTYNNTGIIAGSESAVSTSETNILADDEKWQSIVSKYNMKAMNMDEYSNMLCELENENLISYDEAKSAFFNAGSKYSEDMAVEDMHNGVLGDLGKSLSDYLIDFSDLFDDVTDRSKEYSGYDVHNDQQDFLKEFYAKMMAYT